MGPGVFVPRPETEQVAQVAIDEALEVAARRPGEPVVVVDLCTGSGAIALALATEVPAPGCTRSSSIATRTPGPSAT